MAYIQFSIHNIMVQFTKHIVLSMTHIAINQLVLMDTQHHLTDINIDAMHEMMNLLVNILIMKMNWMELMSALSSLKRQIRVVKNLFHFGEETGKRRDVVIANSVRTNGSRYVHQALWSQIAMYAPQYVQMEQ